MKKKLLLAAVCFTAIILTIIFFIAQDSSRITATENAATENVSLAVYKSDEYSSTAYNSASAQVHVTIEKVNMKGENAIVWEKSFDEKYLSQYPSIGDALKQNIEISNICKKNEYLVVKYNIIYNSKGSELQIQNDVIVKDDNSKNIAISI